MEQKAFKKWGGVSEISVDAIPSKTHSPWAGLYDEICLRMEATSAGRALAVEMDSGPDARSAKGALLKLAAVGGKD